jgi:hypothetical protein
MSRLVTSILKRDQIVERMAAHPFTLALGAVLVFAQAAIYVCEIAGVPLSSWLALNMQAPQAGGLLFAFTHYAPVVGGFSAQDFLASVLLFGVCGVSLLVNGPVVEQYYGTRRTAAVFVLCLAGHALLASALPASAAFSTLAFAMFLAVTALLARLERRTQRAEQQNDARMGLLLASLVLVAMLSGFLGHELYGGLLAAASVGPVLALAVFLLNRRLQIRKVRLKGEGKVGNLYFVEEIDLLTRDEIQERTDRLLEKIAGQGIESLDSDEKRFLKSASRRMKASPSEEASR